MKEVSPPKWPLKFFRFYCSEDRLEELEGDLCEVYNEFIEERGQRFSTLFYWWIVIKSFRTYALKRTKMKEKGFLVSAMAHFRHNLVIAWRNLKKNRTTAIINILGLAMGVGAFLAIFSIVKFELGFNAKIPDAERVYRIRSAFSGAFTATNRGVPIPMGPHVEETFTGVEAVAYFETFHTSVDIPVSSGQAPDIENHGDIILAWPSYFEVINQYEWLVGDPETALAEPNKVVLTSTQAKRYFDTENWSELMDREVIYRDSLSVYVSGIVEAPNYNHDFHFQDFISYATIESSFLKERYDLDVWDNTNSGSQLWLKATTGTSKVDLMMQLEGLDQYVQEQIGESDWVQNYLLQELSEMHFDAEVGIFDNGRNAAHKDTLVILSVVAIAILLIAIFNFVNLETAQSTSKSKEVGIRKVLGSPKSHLVSRFLTESTLISFFAVVISIPIAHYGFQYFEEFLPAGVALDYSNPAFWVTLLLLVLGVGLLAGIYPSWVVSSFKPVKALSPGASSNNPGGSFIRKALILVQFLFSQLLIVGTLAISFQISFMLDKELGFEEDGVLYFYTPYYEKIEKQQLIVNQLNEMPEVLSYAIQNTPPVQRGYSTSTVKYETENGEQMMSAHRKSGDTTYFEFYDIELLAGRNLLPNDTLREYLVNETFIRDLGYENPIDAIGGTFKMGDDDNTIIGVMENIHFRSLHHPIEPMIYSYDESSRCISMKVNADKIEQTIDKLTDKWEEVYPDNTFTVYFMDETIERFYQTERRASKLSSVATGLSILISCLGLFGLISFTIIQKSKEVGIRKVLGASLFHIGSILSKEFIILIVVAFVVSTPISYYFITQMMEKFAYKVEISWWLYVLGGLLSVLIALGSIGVKIWKASGANPIESLRYE